MVENIFRNEDYTRIFACSNCNKGFICKTKYNKPGYRDFDEYLCLYCRIDSKIGVLYYSSRTYDDIPSEFRKGLIPVITPEEERIFQTIWLLANVRPIVYIDDSDYEPPRDPFLFPLKDYLPFEEWERAESDEYYDMQQHIKYINSEDGKRRLLNRINNGDFGECPYCGTLLYPIGGKEWKPQISYYTLACPACSFCKSGSSDDLFFKGWLDDTSKEFLKILPQKVSDLFVTPKISLSLFEQLKLKNQESETLDFKEKYDLNATNTTLSKSSKKELKKDICAFANNKGGYIFTGIREISDYETELVGIYHQELYTDNFISQITHSNSIQPPLLGVILHKIRYNKKYFIIIEVTKSQGAPHFLKGKIPIRNGTTTDYLNTLTEWNSLNL